MVRESVRRIVINIGSFFLLKGVLSVLLLSQSRPDMELKCKAVWRGRVGSVALFGTAMNQGFDKPQLERTIKERTGRFESNKQCKRSCWPVCLFDTHQTELLSVLPYARNAVFDSGEANKLGT